MLLQGTFLLGILWISAALGSKDQPEVDPSGRFTVIKEDPSSPVEGVAPAEGRSFFFDDDATFLRDREDCIIVEKKGEAQQYFSRYPFDSYHHRRDRPYKHIQMDDFHDGPIYDDSGLELIGRDFLNDLREYIRRRRFRERPNIMLFSKGANLPVPIPIIITPYHLQPYECPHPVCRKKHRKVTFKPSTTKRTRPTKKSTPVTKRTIPTSKKTTTSKKTIPTSKKTIPTSKKTIPTSKKTTLRTQKSTTRPTIGRVITSTTSPARQTVCYYVEVPCDEISDSAVTDYVAVTEEVITTRKSPTVRPTIGRAPATSKRPVAGRPVVPAKTIRPPKPAVTVRLPAKPAKTSAPVKQTKPVVKYTPPLIIQTRPTIGRVQTTAAPEPAIDMYSTTQAGEPTIGNSDTESTGDPTMEEIVTGKPMIPRPKPPVPACGWGRPCHQRDDGDDYEDSDDDYYEDDGDDDDDDQGEPEEPCRGHNGQHGHCGNNGHKGQHGNHGHCGNKGHHGHFGHKCPYNGCPRCKQGRK